jgi:Sulfotransferase family
VVPAPQEVFLFLHIPKTGGNSLVRLFEQSLELGTELIRLDNPARELDRRAGRPPFALRPAHERARARIVVGHDVDLNTSELIPGKVARYLTFLRSPAPRLVSAYNFERQKCYVRVGREPIDFERWYSRQERDVVTKFLAKRILRGRFTRHFRQARRYAQYALNRGATERTMRAVSSSLERFWFVGCTEQLDEIAPVLADRLGLGGQYRRDLVAGTDLPKALELTNELECRLNHDNSLDQRLFTIWQDRADEALGALRMECIRKIPH